LVGKEREERERGGRLRSLVSKETEEREGEGRVV
jgi:hypothetical protein